MLRLSAIVRTAAALLRAKREPRQIATLAALDLRPVVAELAPDATGHSDGTEVVTGRSGRRYRRTDDGRWVRDFDQPESRNRVSPHEAVQRFAAWMREQGFDGWHTAADVLGFYRWWAEVHALEEMCPEHLYERLASAPGVIRERRRIASATDPDMVRLRRQTGERRPTLYRIASEGELIASSAAAPLRASPVATRKAGSGERQPASVVPKARASRQERAAA